MEIQLIKNKMNISTWENNDLFQIEHPYVYKFAKN